MTDDKTTGTWTMVQVQMQEGANGATKKKAHKHIQGAQATQATQANTLQASAPELTAANVEHAFGQFSWQGMLGLFIIGLLPFYVIYRIIRKIAGKSGSGKIVDGVEQADYSVPHCKFEETAEGFKVTYRKLPEFIHTSFGNYHKQTNAGGNGLAALFGLLIGLLMTVTIGAVMYIWMIFFPKTIEVTRDLVLINGKKLARKDFLGFNISHTRQIHDNEASAVLGYTYGRKGFKIGGTWTEREATEISSALNSHLRMTPMTGDENRPSPDQLREAARPADF